MYTEYFATTAEDGTEVKVSLSYSLGGINYWTYNTDPRGYYMSAVPVIRESGDGFSSERFTLGKGVRLFLKEVKRRSAKAEAEAEAIARAKASELAERIALDEGLALKEVNA
jgi:hypothetical protein